MTTISGSAVAVTGAAGGIGRALALELAARGADLALADRDEGGLRTVAAEIAKAGARKVTVHRVDVGVPAEIAAFAEAATAAHGGLNIVINNAGVALYGQFDEIDQAHRALVQSASFSDAIARLREALVVFDAMGGTRNLHAFLGFAAGLSSLLGDGPRAARFEGAAQGELKRVGLGREPADAAALSPLLARSRALLGDERFTQCADAGARLPPGEALRELRAWLDGLG